MDLHKGINRDITEKKDAELKLKDFLKKLYWSDQSQKKSKELNRDF